MRVKRLGEGMRETALHESSFVEGSALVNPATVLGPHLIPVSGARIGLQHNGPVGFQYRAPGFLNRLAERGTGYLTRERSHTLLVPLHGANKVLHTQVL